MESQDLQIYLNEPDLLFLWGWSYPRHRQNSL